jgi:outer membrane cobalamin receptor
MDVPQLGASATYGSDAIGSVANVITHNDIEGFRIDARAVSCPSNNDGQSHNVARL